MSATEPSAEFENGEVRYRDVTALTGDVDRFLRKGVVWVRGVHGLPSPLEDFDLRIRLPDGSALKLRGRIVSQVGSDALIQLDGDAGQLCAAVRRSLPVEPAPAPPLAPPLAPPKVAPVPVARPAIPARAPATLRDTQRLELPESFRSPEERSSSEPPLVDPDDIPRRGTVSPQPPTLVGRVLGTLTNPIDLRDLALLPLDPRVTVTDLGQPSLIGLVRWLGARKATGILTVQSFSKAPTQIQIAFRRGRILAPKQEASAYVKAATWPSAQFGFDETAEVEPSDRVKPMHAWTFVVGIVKGLLRDTKLPALHAILPAQRAPRLKDDAADFLDAVDLSPSERRFAERRLDGKEPLERMYRGVGLDERWVARLVGLLELLGFLEWSTPPAQEEPKEEDDVRVLYQRRAAGGDAFRALGVHHSDAPSRLRSVYRAVLAEYGPGSPGHERSPVWSQKLVDLTERSYRALEERESRQRARRELGIDLEAAARFMFDQAKLARVRGEVPRARELLEAAIDIDRTQEYLDAWRALSHGPQAAEEIEIPEDEKGE